LRVAVNPAPIFPGFRVKSTQDARDFHAVADAAGKTFAFLLGFQRKMRLALVVLRKM
jgi:hypothetical protein